MLRNALITVGVLAIIIALPFAFHQRPASGDWQEGDPVLVIVSPHSEATRHEFAVGFSKWHKEHFGRPVRIDWRNVGGTSEISRYLRSEYSAAARAWWMQSDPDNQWPDNVGDQLVGRATPSDPSVKKIYDAIRDTDDPEKITCKIDLYFGGGEFDHSDAFARGLTVVPWDPANPPDYVRSSLEQIPERLSGELWRTPSVFGAVLSTFGIVYNIDRLNDLEVDAAPKTWRDLTNPKYFGQVGLTDPTKSGSISKAFEMIIQTEIHNTLIDAGYSDDQINQFEQLITQYKATKKPYQRGDVPTELVDYQATIERGWEEGISLVQQIGANARYFTDSASKVPIDVSTGDATVGMCVDFYGRYQAQVATPPGESPRMIYVTPAGGTSVSADPISLLRGAPNREIAQHFIAFVLSIDGQRLWTQRVGTPDGPVKYALRRLPIRKDFYFEGSKELAADVLSKSTDDLSDPTVDPYQIAQQFTYHPRWTNEHFGVQRELIRAMCLDSAAELKAAWKRHHDPNRLRGLPTVTLEAKDGTMQTVKLTWRNAPDMSKRFNPIEYTRKWTTWYRKHYQSN